jgi:DNA-binding MarR family transcriptional regulator
MSRRDFSKPQPWHLMIALTDAIMVQNKPPTTREKRNMTSRPPTESLDLRVVRIVYQTYTRYQTCLDGLLAPQGLNTERYFVLLAIKNHGDTARIVDIAHWAARSSNTVTMMVDRMVKDGLLRRQRDRRDRRVVNVSITSKADNLLISANVKSVQFTREIMSQLSDDDERAIVNLFTRINYSLLQRLNPGQDVEAILKHDSDLHDNLVKTMAEQRALITGEPE